MNTGLLTQENAVLITFDDGYESFYTQAFPILSELGFPATEFVTYAKLKDSVDRKRENMISPLTFVEIEEMVKTACFLFKRIPISSTIGPSKLPTKGNRNTDPGFMWIL
jgi:hypothetical protein